MASLLFISLSKCQRAVFHSRNGRSLLNEGIARNINAVLPEYPKYTLYDKLLQRILSSFIHIIEDLEFNYNYIGPSCIRFYKRFSKQQKQ